MKDLLSQEMEKSPGMTGLDWEHQQMQTELADSECWEWEILGVRKRCQAIEGTDCRDLGADQMGNMYRAIKDNAQVVRVTR